MYFPITVIPQIILMLKLKDTLWGKHQNVYHFLKMFQGFLDKTEILILKKIILKVVATVG